MSDVPFQDAPDGEKICRLIDRERERDTITAEQAKDDIAVARLAPRIVDLKKRGIDIGVKMIAVKNRFDGTVHVLRYWLEKL